MNATKFEFKSDGSTWFEETQFWMDKCELACIRRDIASSKGDLDTYNRAQKQVELYIRKAKEVHVPDHVKEFRAQAAQREQAKIEAALSEEL